MMPLYYSWQTDTYTDAFLPYSTFNWITMDRWADEKQAESALASYPVWRAYPALVTADQLHLVIILSTHVPYKI